MATMHGDWSWRPTITGRVEQPELTLVAPGERREQAAEVPRRIDPVPLSVEVVRDFVALESLTPEWDRLESDIVPRTPFRSARWNLLWWRHFRENSAAVRDELCVHVFRDENRRLIGIAPMMLTRWPGRYIPLVRQLQYFGSDPNVTEIRGLICRPRDQKRVVEALQRQLVTRQSEWDWVQWSGLDRRAEGSKLLEDESFTTQTPIEEFYLSLPADWEEFRASLSRNVKESIRKGYNSLKREGHSFTFRVVSDRADVSEAVDRFLELHCERASMTQTVAHPNVFASAVSQGFLLDYATSMAEQGRLRIFQLLIGGEVVATRIGFLLGDEIYLYFSGYSAKWGRYSVMTTLLAEALRWAIENRLVRAHLSRGRDVSKLRWGPTVVTRENGVQTGRTWNSAVRLKVFETLKKHSRGTSLVGKILRRLRRNGLGDVETAEGSAQ